MDIKYLLLLYEYIGILYLDLGKENLLPYPSGDRWHILTEKRLLTVYLVNVIGDSLNF